MLCCLPLCHTLTTLLQVLVLVSGVWHSTAQSCDTTNALRLVGSTTPVQGRVEICLNSQWGTVCDNLWGSADAQVVCRQLGYSANGAQYYKNAYFGQGTGPIQLDNVNCTGTEQRLIDCPLSTSHNCGHYEDAGVSCAESCATEGGIRLIGGTQTYEGRVELCTGGQWTTVCDDYWGSLDAQVACRQLGYSTERALAFSTAYFGQGAGPILLDNVHCAGNESSLLECNHLYNQSNCAHSADAGVRCQLSNATTCLEGDLRLVNGQNQYEGRVEICLNNVWGTVCDDSWSSTDARVVCRQLGYGTDGAQSFPSAYFGQGTGPIQIEDVGCGGSESALVQCNHLTIISCGHYEDAGARCSAPDNCTEGDVRLVSGQSPNEGRVEICLEGQWGTVCDDSWGSVDAQVACSQLGYLSTGAQAQTSAYYGQGTGPIQLNNVQCTGSEVNLLQCIHSTIDNCSNFQDAGIRCRVHPVENCSAGGAVRLVGGRTDSEGRVEYCTGGVWGTVCDTFWDAVDASVICNQLGYPSVGAVPLYNAQFGQGAGPVIINTITCTSSAQNISQCTITTPSTCSHSNDSGLRCAEYCNSEGQVRLVGGDNVREGRVEICSMGMWRAVCDNFWNQFAANVVCQQLGYSFGNAVAFSAAYFGQGAGIHQFGSFLCNGTEATLLECVHASMTCEHTRDAGVRCRDNATLCTEGQLRLVGGSNSSQGRVEVCSSMGTWGTVCDDQWGSPDAQVVCRQLGYPTTGAIAHGRAHYGQGTGPILYDNVQCSGSEHALEQCTRLSIDNCQHYEDAGVSCQARENCVTGDVRLANGINSREGRVEICVYGQWGSVCDETWTYNETEVVCSQLGKYSLGGIVQAVTYQEQANVPVFFDSLTCKGSESQVLQCTLTTGMSCNHTQDVGLVCPESCSVEGSLRLVGGDSQRDGVVEVCQNGVWGTVCSDQWGVNNAAVVCRQMGYAFDLNVYGGDQGTIVPSLNYSSSVVQFSDVQCVGNETSLLDCTYNSTAQCSSTQRAGVLCPAVVQIVEQAVDITVSGLNDATFSCSAFSYPAPSIMWYRQQGNGSLQQLTDTSKYSVSSNVSGTMNQTSVLTVTKALLSDAGTYVCQATSSVTSDISSASLTVLRICTNNTFRLVGSGSVTEGSVQVCQNGVWGPVCDDQWDVNDAAVVCRQLGYPFNVPDLHKDSTIPISNYGKEFYIGFLKNFDGFVDYLQLIVRAESSSAVQFGVRTSAGVVHNGTTTASSPVTIYLPTSLAVTSSSYAFRNKGVHVYTIGAGSISVLAINYFSSSVGDYLAYPCHEIGNGTYEYFVVSTDSVQSTSNSAFLLVGCADNTTITITPTQLVTVPTYPQNTTQSYTQVSSGTSRQITLHAMQTLIVESLVDLTGSRVVSNKPLTVISGHECGNVPTYQSYCQHLTEQIPPTSTWGRRFLLVPFGGRNVGQYFKIVSSQSNTTISRTCNSVTSTQTLSSAGNSFTFFTNSTSYCYVVSDKPTIVSQLGIGGDLDNIGNPIISILPSLDQYTNSYTFSSLSASDFNIHQISVSVLPQYYQPNSIRLDGQAITATWSAIYDSGGNVVGYGCHQSVAGGVSHTVSHDNPSGKLAVVVHGWNSGGLRSYGYLAGLRFNSAQPVAVKNLVYGSTGSPFQFSGVQCIGNESSLFDCSYNTLQQCPVNSNAGVVCPTPQPPANVRVGSIQGRSINVTWSSVAGASQYMVYYRPDKSYQVTDPSYNSSEQSVRTVSTQVTLSGLYPASTYTVYIRSVNAVGTGAASTSVTVVLSPAAPDSVPMITASTTQGIVLNLQKPSNINGELSHYQLVVVYLPTGRLPAQQPDEAFPETSLLTYSEVQGVKLRAVAYVAAEFSDDGFPARGQFVIGDRNQPNDYPTCYTNGALTGGQYYTFFLRAFPKLGTIQKRQSDPTRQYNVSSSSDYTSPPIQAPDNTVIIITAVVVIVVLLVMIVIAVLTVVVIMRTRHKRRKFEVAANMPIIHEDNDDDQLDVSMKTIQVEQQEENAEIFSGVDATNYQAVDSAFKH